MVAGDCNARVSVKNDYICLDRIIEEIDGTDYIPDIPLKRYSKDSVSNDQGVKLLDLCKATSLRIANGRLGDDYGIGSFTYVNRNACSVIDYLLLKESDFKLVNNFKIRDFTEFSDHAPISFDIVGKKYSSINNCFNIESVHWDNEKKNAFRRIIIGQLPAFNSLIENVDSSDHTSVDNLISQFSSIIRNAGDPLFLKNCTINRGFNCKNSNTSKWFDEDCKNAKHSYKSFAFIKS